MHFDESYFEEEIREGFRIRPMVKRAWASQLEILAEIDRICKKHNIMYFAEWGTLLGAVRHHGFIPWDDDLDVGMKRKDYWRFLEICSVELSEPFEIHNVRTEPEFREVMSRVTNGHAIKTEPSFLKQFHGCPYMCGIDIFPNDNIPDDEDEQKKYAELFSVADGLGVYWDTDHYSENEKKGMLAFLEHNIARKIKPHDGLTMSQAILDAAEQIASAYCMDDTEYIGQVDLFSGRGYKLHKSLFETTIDFPFENTTIPVPIGYDSILRKKYGDNYMTPVYHGGAHDYPFFKEYEETLYKALIEMYGEVPVQYRY